tara:strand:- start:1111 stop:1296 length:186 start_codon:yes stop_codon:yes gene_type:complete
MEERQRHSTKPWAQWLHGWIWAVLVENNQSIDFELGKFVGNLFETNRQVFWAGCPWETLEK